MLETEARFFWTAAQRLRLTTGATIQDLQDALDDVVAIGLHTDSDKLRARCMELIEGGAKRCASSA